MNQYPLHGIAYYNPDLLSKDELKQQFIARQDILDRLLEDIGNEAEDSIAQHHLILGQRGMGKTTLLQRLRYAVEDDPVLAQHWIALSFPEEQYNISHPADLWLNCLDALGDYLEQHGQNQQVVALDKLIDTLNRRDEREALHQLLQQAKQLNCRFILLFDNIDLIFSRLKKEQWALRETLQSEPALLLIGASAQWMEATYQDDQAFYDFFQIHELKGLSHAEMHNTLLHLANIHQQPQVTQLLQRDSARTRVLHNLTGGNPRTTMILFNILAQGLEGNEVRSDLERLLDQVTPLYKARFEELPDLGQQLVDAIAIHWHPVTAGVLASKLQWKVNLVSAQLRRLETQGVIEKVKGYKSKRQHFQVAERFFNIWYLMRTSRRVRRNLIWLVYFLNSMYSQQEINEHAKSHLNTSASNWRNAEYSLALAQASKDKHLSNALECQGLHTFLHLNDRRARNQLFRYFDKTEDAPLISKAKRITALKTLKDQLITAQPTLPDKITDNIISQLVGSPTFDLEEKQQLLKDLLGNDTEAQPLALKKITKDSQENKQRWDYGYQAVYQAIERGELAHSDDAEGFKTAATHDDIDYFSLLAEILEMTQQKANHKKIKALEDQVDAFKLPWLWLQIGDVYEESQEFDHAKRCYQKALDIDKNSKWSWAYLGGVLGLQKHYVEAEKAFKKALALDDQYVWAWNQLALNYSYQEDYVSAKTAFRKSVEIDDKQSGAWAGLGNILRFQTRYAEAEQALQKALELDNKNIWVWNELGINYRAQENYASAETAFRKSVEIDDKQSGAWAGLGNILRLQTRYAEAEQALQKALELDNKYLWAWNQLGRNYGYQENYASAETAFRKIIEIDDKQSGAWANLGNMLRLQTRYAEAEQALQTSLALDNKDIWAWNVLGKNYSDQENYASAETAFRKSVEIDDKQSGIWANLGNMLRLQTRYAEAEQALLKSLEIDDQSSWANNRLVALYFETKQIEKWADIYRKQTLKDNKSAQLWNSLAWRFYKNQFSLEEALEAAQQAIALDPDEIYYQHTLATLLVHHQRWFEAVPYIRRYIQQGDEDFHQRIWADNILLFKEAVNTGYAPQAVALLDELGLNERWRPLREALCAAVEQTTDYLNSVAPEIRTPALQIYQQFFDEQSSPHFDK